MRRIYKSISVFLGSLILSLIFFSIANAAQYDLAISNSDISFSKNTFVAGEKIRIYAKINNVGTEDIKGYVSFFQTNKLIDSSQAISLRPGASGDVWVDYTIPDAEFNILARIQGTQPADQNKTNDEALTARYKPDIDTDGDGLSNAVDPDDDNDGITDLQEKEMKTNPLLADTDGDGVNDRDDKFPLNNKETMDTDNDGQGNNADPDDDNDGITDLQEKEMKTNPLLADTDGDGVNDRDDKFPLDSAKWQEERDIFSPSTNPVNEEPNIDIDITKDLTQQIIGETIKQSDEQINSTGDKEYTGSISVVDEEGGVIFSKQIAPEDIVYNSFYMSWWFWGIISLIIIALMALYFLHFSRGNKKSLLISNKSTSTNSLKRVNINKPNVVDLRKIKK